MQNTLLQLLSGCTVVALALALHRRKKATIVAAGTTLWVSLLVTTLVSLEVRPVSDWWAQGGVAILPPFAIALYGLGAAVAWRISRSVNSLKAAVACVIATPLVAFGLYQSAVAEVETIVRQVPSLALADRALILEGGRGEAMNIITFGGALAFIALLVLATTSRRSGAPSVGSGQTINESSRSRDSIRVDRMATS